ncbi:MAG TPA: amidohydrolase family protein, partial [Acidimicrobiales bacterium]
MMTAIDAHAHVIVPELLREAAPGEAWRPSVSRVDGRQVVELDGRRITSAVDEFVAAAGPPPADPELSADRITRRFLFDSVVHDPQLLRALIEAVGADRVLLGSDYPFDMADRDPVATVRAAGLDEDVEAAVLYGNAERELRRA